MTISTEEFLQKFSEARDGIMRDYEREDGAVLAACHVMHLELGLDQTPAEDAEERISTLKEQGVLSEDWTNNGVDFTDEHRALHEFISAYVQHAAISGMPVTQIMAEMFVIGRRMGLSEAASSLGEVDFDIDLSQWATSAEAAPDEARGMLPGPVSNDPSALTPEGDSPDHPVEQDPNLIDPEGEGDSDVTNAS